METTAPTGVAETCSHDRPSVCLRGDESDLYRTHHRRLLSTVRRAINGPDTLVEDACQFAWMQLCRCQPERGSALHAWLRTVALHEAYRLLAPARKFPRAVHAGTDEDTGYAPGEPVDPDRSPGRVELDSQLQAREALREVAALPERQREYIQLRLVGHSYREIVQLTGRSYTNVNKHLTRARAALRDSAGRSPDLVE